MPQIESNNEAELLKLAANGHDSALGRLLENHRPRLERIVQLRLDHRVQSRLNASDVLQETYIEATQRLAEYVKNPEVPFFIWLRFLANQRLSQLHRHHLGRQTRDAGREISIDQGGADDSAGTMASQLIGKLSSASTVLQKAELRQQLLAALDGLEPVDREILVLRHFEQLTNVECAEVLQLSPTAASNRYIRALERLRTVLGQDSALPGR